MSLGHVENQKNGTRDENSSAQHVFKKSLNYKIKTSPARERSTTSFSSHPASAPTSYQCLVGIANAKAKAFNVGIWEKNFLRQQLSMLHHAIVPPHPEPKPQKYTLNFASLGLRLSSHTSLFWTLPEQLSMLHHAFVPTHPEPTSQRCSTKPQTVRCSSHTSVLNFAATALHVTPRMWANPFWTNVPRHTTNFRSDFFISHIPVLNFAGTDCTMHVCQPWTNVPKIHPRNLTP